MQCRVLCQLVPGNQIWRAIVSIIVCVLSSVILGQIHRLDTPLPTRDALSKFDYPKSTTVYLSEEAWTFAASKRGDRILGTRKKGERSEILELHFDGELDQIIGINAAVSNGAHVVIAVASLDDVRSRVSYRMLFGRRLVYKTDQRVEDVGWSLSDTLIETAADYPFNLMAAGGIGGDSVFVTLQRYVRGPPYENDRVETHTFSNHCPMPFNTGRMTMIGVLHDSATLEIVTSGNMNWAKRKPAFQSRPKVPNQTENQRD
jgi:hypothetical protein